MKLLMKPDLWNDFISIEALFFVLDFLLPAFYGIWVMRKTLGVFTTHEIDEDDEDIRIRKVIIFYIVYSLERTNLIPQFSTEISRMIMHAR